MAAPCSRGDPIARKIIMRKMNKAIAATLTAAMLLSMGTTTAFAEDTTPDTKTTTLTYTVQSSYTWSVPSTITFTKGNSTDIVGTPDTTSNGKVKVESCVIPYNNQLTITVEGSGTANDSGNKAFTITTGTSGKAGEVLSYTLKSGNNNVTTGDAVLTVDAGTNTANSDLTFTLTTASGDNVAEKSGTYTGTATFTATVAEKSNS